MAPQFSPLLVIHITNTACTSNLRFNLPRQRPEEPPVDMPHTSSAFSHHDKWCDKESRVISNLETRNLSLPLGSRRVIFYLRDDQESQSLRFIRPLERSTQQV